MLSTGTGPHSSRGSAPLAVEALADALSRYQATELLDGSEFGDAARGRDAASFYGPLLDRAEAANDLVLLDAGTIGSGRPWDEFCLQQADRVLAPLRMTGIVCAAALLALATSRIAS